MLIGFNYGNLNETDRYRDRVGVYCTHDKEVDKYVFDMKFHTKTHWCVHKLRAFNTKKSFV